VVDGEGPDLDPASGAASEVPASPEPQGLTPRQVRARRRRRRRRFGTLAFLLVAGGVFAAAYFVLAGGGSSSGDGKAASRSGTTTTAAPPFFATYKVTSGLNVRGGPGTSSPTVGIVEQGHEVTAVCVAEGEAINGTDGLPNTKWLKIAGSWKVGYVSAAYVLTGSDLTSGKIPACPAA
jgi:Bacterial SH3 domain